MTWQIGVIFEPLCKTVDTWDVLNYVGGGATLKLSISCLSNNCQVLESYLKFFIGSFN